MAVFELRNDSLFLDKILIKYDIQSPKKEGIDLTPFFKKEKDIFVDWYSGTLTSPKNNLIYEHDGWGGFYEYETDFLFEKGILKKTQQYKNEIKPSLYTNNNNGEILMDFIKSHINYRNVPPVQSKIRITIRIEDVDLNGKITKVSVFRGHDDYNEEAIRVVKSIPQWQVIVRRGKKEHIPWMIPVFFEKD